MNLKKGDGSAEMDSEYRTTVTMSNLLLAIAHLPSLVLFILKHYSRKG